MKRPRKYRPVAVEREVLNRQSDPSCPRYFICACGCGEVIGSLHFDHNPPLHLRKFSKRKNDYIPAENDPKYLFALIDGHHIKKTTREAKARKKVRNIIKKQLGRVVKEHGGGPRRKHHSRFPKGRTMPGSKASGWKKPMNKQAERR